jgi:hypothetical protein
MAKSWSVPTWIFLHTLAANIPEERYPSLRAEVLQNIKALCSVLPCPDCARHATDTLAKVELKHVMTKDALKEMLWTFHNSVNARLRKKQFTKDELAIYDRCNLAVIYFLFYAEFTKPSHNSKLMMDVMQRNGVMKKFNAWMRSRIFAA